MSAENNRAASNLLLLCFPHAYEIDQPQFVKKYPAPELRKWKQRQIAAYDEVVAAGGNAGYDLTDEEAQQVILQSDGSTTITLTADTINVGGTGGQAPSASGGGGGAVGVGVVVAGDGGEAPAHVNLEGTLGAAPGAGGGGGGGVEAAAIPIPPEVAGTEGIGYIAGFDGADAGDAVFSSGDIVLTAKDGQGGSCTPGVDRSTSDQIALSALLLANYSEIRGGLATIVGAAWQNVCVLNVPATCTFCGFAVLEAGGVDPGVYSITFELQNPDGEVKATLHPALAVDSSGDVIRVPMWFNLVADVDRWGVWTIVVKSATSEMGSLKFVVKRVPSSS